MAENSKKERLVEEGYMTPDGKITEEGIGVFAGYLRRDDFSKKLEDIDAYGFIGEDEAPTIFEMLDGPPRKGLANTYRALRELEKRGIIKPYEKRRHKEIANTKDKK